MSRQKKKITIYRIAEEAQVSTTTVSRVLNRRTGVGKEARDRINALLMKYEFKADYPRPRAPKIAVICPWNDLNDYFRKAMKGIFRYVQEHNMEVGIITHNAGRPHTLLDQIRDQQCSAVIVLLGEQFHGEHLELSESELPVVFLDMQVNMSGSGFIDNDSYSGSSQATAHLLALGHRNIGYLRYNSLSLNQNQRLQGFCDTMAASGLSIQKHWIIEADEKDWSICSEVIGMRLAHRLLCQAPEVTAILAADDGLALGALTAIHERGLRIPKDISIVGFDNYPETEASYPPLTTIDHPIEMAGYKASKAIDHALNNPGNWKLPRKTLPTQLVVRQSTGPVGQKMEKTSPLAEPNKFFSILSETTAIAIP